MKITSKPFSTSIVPPVRKLRSSQVTVRGLVQSYVEVAVRVPVAIFILFVLGFARFWLKGLVRFSSVEGNLITLFEGHVVKKNCKPGIADGYCFESSDLRSVIFPSDSENVIATSTRKLSEVVHTQAKVVAEDVLYKYISKNVLFLSIVTPKAISDIGSVIPEDSWLYVYLVDIITGRVLHRMSHHGC